MYITFKLETQNLVFADRRAWVLGFHCIEYTASFRSNIVKETAHPIFNIFFPWQPEEKPFSNLFTQIILSKGSPADVIFMCSLEKDGEELDGYNVDVSLIYCF